MYNHHLHKKINQLFDQAALDKAGADNDFYIRIMTAADTTRQLYNELYGALPNADQLFFRLIALAIKAYTERLETLKKRDAEKAEKDYWFLSNELTGMSLYADRFCRNLKNLPGKLDYFEKLGVNLLHLMPVFESPAAESDGGYAVSDFRKVDARFGTLKDLQKIRSEMDKKGMYLMLDIVLNHTSNQHEWAKKAQAGDPEYQDFYYMFNDWQIPDEFEQNLPEIFPEAAPGNFTWVPACNKWVMTVFHNYQWDLNYRNPAVLQAMLDNVFFYANLGVDILRIDAPAFIWKQAGTQSMNLPQVHTLLRLIKQFISMAAPGMAVLGEAIVAPAEILKYFGSGLFEARECDFAYNATQMALQWDMLATGDTRAMLSSQHELQQKPYGASWITYTRCHDDIGLGFDDQVIRNAGFDPWEHRKFLKEYYTGNFYGSMASGALFAVNPKNGDARISGTLASLCGLETAIKSKQKAEIDIAINRILLMQAHSLFLGGLPMLFYGDEAGYINDYSYLTDPGKSYDNRWMHRPVIDWKKNALVDKRGTVEQRIFSGIQKLISIRKSLPEIADHKNITWLQPEDHHIAAYLRAEGAEQLLCIFNFGTVPAAVSTEMLTAYTGKTKGFYDYWAGKIARPNPNGEFIIQPYGFALLKPR